MASVILADNGTVSGSAGIKSSADSSGVLALATGSGTTAVTIDASQNVGLGVTPSAKFDVYSTNNAFNALQVRYNGSNDTMGFGIANANGFPYLGYNTKSQASSDTPVYERTNSAAQLRMDNGAFKFSIAASGTAGNAITFTQAMTLDASGNLLVGETTAGYSSAGRGLIEVNGSSTAMYALRIGSANKGYIYHDGTQFRLSNDVGSGGMTFSVNGGAEAGRFDSSGNLLVGTTETSSTPTTGVKVYPSYSGTGSSAVVIAHVNGGGGVYANFIYNSGVIGSISQSGTSAVLYNVTSDQRLKENIVDAPEFGDVLDSIQVRSYDWITDKTHQRAGFIAQELVAIAPEAVHQPVNEEEMMAVDYSKLVPMLVKEIQSLRKRLAAAGI